MCENRKIIFFLDLCFRMTILTLYFLDFFFCRFRQNRISKITIFGQWVHKNEWKYTKNYWKCLVMLVSFNFRWFFNVFIGFYAISTVFNFFIVFSHKNHKIFGKSSWKNNRKMTKEIENWPKSLYRKTKNAEKIWIFQFSLHATSWGPT